MRVPTEERKIQLIAATVELMRREGVQSVTMRAIAQEANAPLATAHYCFSNKDELMDAAAEAWLKNLNRFSSDVPVHLGLRKAVEQIAEGYWRSLEEEPASLVAEIELIMWATRNAESSPLAAKIYPAYEVELGDVLAQVLAGPCRWVGVMGSLRHTAPHVAALRERGLPDEAVARVHRPIGLDIGSKMPAEIALSTVAGLLADRNGKTGGPFPTAP